MKLYAAAALCLFVTLASAADLDKCAWGESYWCSDLQAAKTCGAFKHCMSTIWKNQQLTQDSTEVCDFCEAIIDDVRRFITDNRTESDISHFLISACGVIPEEMIAGTCKILAQEFTPEIMQMLSESVNPQVICGLMKMCSGLEDNVMHSELRSQQALFHVPLKKTPLRQQPDYCGDCKRFFTDFKIKLTDKTEQEVLEQFLDNVVCVWFGPMKKRCQEMVSAFLPLYLEYIAQFDDPTMICSLIRFCTEDARPTLDHNVLNVFELLKKRVSDDECATCKSIVAELQALIRTTALQKQIVDVLKNDVCPLFGQSKTECQLLVDAYAPTAFSFLATWLDPDARCRGFGFCPSDIVRHNAPKLRDVSDPEVCALCEYVLKEVRSMLANNATEEEVIAGLDKVCGVLPSPLDKSCKDFVNEYVSTIINMIRQEVDPEQICSLLGLCSQYPVTEHARSRPINRDTQKLLGVSGSQECVLCEFILGTLKRLFANNETKTELINMLDQLCGLLPSPTNATCKYFVDEYVRDFITHFHVEFDPAVVCSLLGVCSQNPVTAHVNKDTPKLPSQNLREVRDSEECKLCKFVVTAVKHLLAKNTTEKEILETLDKLCGLLPSPSNTSCKDFIDKYVPAIITMIQTEVDPAQICSLLGLCSEMPLTAPVGDADVCLICETVVQYIEALLEDKSSVDEIEKLLKKVCNFLPDSMKAQCANIVDAYGAMIIHLITTEYTPEQVCKKAKLCSSEANKMPMASLEAGQPVLVGTNKCTQGPAYWCASQENAEHCGTVEHCKKYVWKD